MNRLLLTIINFIILTVFCSVSFAQSSLVVFMGDWQGNRTLSGGKQISLSAQVIAWEKGRYQANLLNEFDKPGSPIIQLEGSLQDNKVIFDKKNENGIDWSGEIKDGKFTGKFSGTENGTFEMKKCERLSPTLNAKPPKGAVILFDGRNLDQWDIIKKKKKKDKGKKVVDPLPGTWKLVKENAMEIVPGTGSLITKRKFSNFKLHLEFRTPFLPEAKSQARGNSGVFLQGRYEVQVLDSYGLEGLDNECGGLYKLAKPLVNMCTPPLQWQTYDITFYAPVFGSQGKKTKNARITVFHNGVIIHNDLEMPEAFKGGYNQQEEKEGVIFLQDHNNPVQYRNIWVEEIK